MTIRVSAPLLTEHATALLCGSLALHLLRDLDVDFEELADAAVEADGLALVEVGFAVGSGNALLGAGVDEPVGEGGSVSWREFGRASYSELYQGTAYWLNMPETISISASAAAIFSAEEG